MPDHPAPSGRKSSALRALVSASAALALAVGLLALTPVSASADTSAPTGSNLGVNLGQNLAFEQPTQAVTTVQRWNLDSQPDGSVRFVDSTAGKCLSIFSLEMIFPVYGTLLRDTCKDEVAQKFYFVPQNHTPHSAANMSRGDQFFYIVSPVENKCVWSASGGFNVPGRNDALVLKTCSEGDPGEEFRIYNEQPNPAGIYNEWANILNHAAIYASNRCGADYNSCEVSSPNGDYPNRWFRPYDDAIADMGTLATESFGCGVGFTNGSTIYSPKETNNTLDVTTKVVGSQLSVTKTTQVTETLGYSLSVETSGGLKDVWGIKVTNGFTYQHQTVKGSSTTQTTTDTTSRTVRPGDTLMATWAGSVFNITGTWKFAENLAVLDPEHRSLSWTMPATSSFPVTVSSAGLAQLTGVTSRYPKNCDASAASSIKPTSVPKIVAETADCTAAAATPATASSGTTLKACPGEWNVPVGKGSSNPTFVYQWYVVGPDGTTKFPIDGANKQTFTVQPSTYSAATPNLLVSVYDEGNADRLESRPAVITPVKVIITPTALGAERQVATNFVGTIDDAQTGTAYSADLVSARGSGTNLSVSSTLPAGMSVSPEGVLSGTPQAAGTYAIDLVDTPTDGGPVQNSTVQLTVYNPPADFVTDSALSATVGTAVDTALVPSVPLGMNLSVTSGSLPTGMALDPATGVLRGTPAVAGVYGFAVQDAGSPNTYGAFTVTVSDRPAVLTSAGLAAAQVGTPYSAQTVTAPGSHALIGLTATSDALPDGLSLNSLTGEITGVPTAAGSAALTLVDLNNPATTVSTTLSVAAAGAAVSPAPPADGSPTPTPPARASGAKSASLANTGVDTTGPLVLALSLLAAGVVLAVRRSRRRHC